MALIINMNYVKKNKTFNNDNDIIPLSRQCHVLGKLLLIQQEILHFAYLLKLQDQSINEYRRIS